MYRTGPYLVDPTAYEVRAGGRTVSLEPNVMRVLVYFLERPGAIVTKEALLRDVWEGRYVSDDVVAVAVYQIRKAFSDHASRPKFLETVHRRGYRWCAPVTKADDGATARRRFFWMSAAAIAAALLVSVLSTTRSSPPSLEARSAYEKGRYFLDRRSPDAMRRAVASFEEAARLEPGWSAAHAGLADARALQVDLGMARAEDVEEEARRLTERALALGPASSEGWTSLGLTRLLFDLDLDSSEAAFGRALELDDENPFAHQAFAWHLAARGRMDEAIAHGRRASVLAPTLSSPHLDLAFILGLAGRHDEAVREIEASLDLGASSPAAHVALGWAHTLAGREEQALSAFRRYLTLAGASRLPETDGVDDYFRYELTTHGPRMTWWARARLHAVLGEKEDALVCLENAYRERDTGVLWVATDPAFAPLRAEERFRSLLRERL